MIGKGYSIHQQNWPEYQETFLESDTIKIAVQVNGKVREIWEINSDIVSNESDIVKMALESQKVQKFLDGKEPKKTIYVRGKIVNVVV